MVLCICCGILSSSITAHYRPNQSIQNYPQEALNKISLCTFPKKGGRGKTVRASPEVTATTSSRVPIPVEAILLQLQMVSAGSSFYRRRKVNCEGEKLCPHSCEDGHHAGVWLFNDTAILGLPRPNQLAASTGWIWVGLLL